MMRLIVSLSLLVLFLFGVGLWLYQAAGQPPARAEAAPVVAPRSVKGLGRDVRDAQRDALRRAVETAHSFLLLQEPPLTWEPDERFVRTYLLDGEGRLGEDVRLRDLVRVEDDNPLPDEVRKSWVLSFSEANWDYLLRQAQSHQHQLLARNLLIGACLVLLVGLGFARLRS